MDYRRALAALGFASILMCVGGCVRRDGRNSDCRWPAEVTKQAASPRHLSEDAEFAEDLAIRYADVHHGLRTPYFVSREDYTAGRERCMGTLFAEAGKQHNVAVESLYGSLGRNRYIDLAEILPFAVLLAFCVPRSRALSGGGIRLQKAGLPAW